MQIVWGLIKAFLVGGALCVVGEALVLKTKLTPGPHPGGLRGHGGDPQRGGHLWPFAAFAAQAPPCP